MRGGKCPKCASNNVYRSHNPAVGGGIGWGDNPEYMRIKAKWGSDSIKKWETFLCADCGYYENYVIDREILDGIIAGLDDWVKISS